jgi:hypothetical protein
MTNANQCHECKLGEHEDYDDDVRLVTVSDPDTGKRIKRAKLCGEHREMFASDGYDVD